MSNLWYPFTPMKDWTETPQLSIVGGEKNYLIASDGTRYLDGVSSLWTNVHGHNHPALNQAIADQLKAIAHSTLLGLSSPPAETLATRLVEISPTGLNHVFFSDSGSTAVEIALKQGFQYWQLVGRPQKTEFVHLDQAYHGDTLGAVAVGGIDVFHKTFGPLLLHTHAIPCPNAYFHSHSTNQVAAEQRSLQALTDYFAHHADTTAAFIIEPLVQGAGGILTHSTDYLRAASALCTQYDVLLIVDEVATGFGRTGSMFASDCAAIKPDLMCLAKGLTGGYLPLAATLSTDRIYNAFLAPRSEGKTFFHGHTYTGNALSCAAALANLDIFEAESTLANVQPSIRHLETQLKRLADHPLVGDIRQRGLMVGIQIVKDRDHHSPFPANDFAGHKISLHARQHGVIIRNLSDVVVLMPPLTISQDQIDQLVLSVRSGLDLLLP